jgi:hypothetical protein
MLKASGLTQGDSTFAVPGVSGCGVASLLDAAINLKEGLPSAAGNNSIVLNDASSFTARFYPPRPNAGQLLSDAWHSAVCSGACAIGALAPAPTATPRSGPLSALPFCLLICGIIF